ncbi:hypothetical protein KP509_1Z175000 [Ceratopteris richardii]|nr:hypothetical protein KP509_1Z175000 [Ceratopteris richardii]
MSPLLSTMVSLAAALLSVNASLASSLTIGERFVSLLTDYGLRNHQRSAVPMSRALCEQTCMGSFSETTHCQLLCFASHFMIAESL